MNQTLKIRLKHPIERTGEEWEEVELSYQPLIESEHKFRLLCNAIGYWEELITPRVVRFLETLKPGEGRHLIRRPNDLVVLDSVLQLMEADGVPLTYDHLISYTQ